jgi:hypothetical protein
MYSSWYILCAYYVGWLLAGLEWKHVETIIRNKLKTNSASCWSYYTDFFHQYYNNEMPANNATGRHQFHLCLWLPQTTLLMILYYTLQTGMDALRSHLIRPASEYFEMS